DAGRLRCAARGRGNRAGVRCAVLARLRFLQRLALLGSHSRRRRWLAAEVQVRVRELLPCGISTQPTTPLGHQRPVDTAAAVAPCSLRPKSGQANTYFDMSASCPGTDSCTATKYILIRSPRRRW